ncbi:MAG: primosomal protein N' [Desulfobacterales bacterium]
MPGKFPETLEVAVPLPLAETFTYGVPAELAGRILPGMRVTVPFGRRRMTAWALGPGRQPDRGDLKAVLEAPDSGPIFPPAMIPFFRWTAAYYKQPLGEVIKTALPAGTRLAERTVYRLREETPGGGGETPPLAPDEERVLGLLRGGGKTFAGLARVVPAARLRPLLSALERKGLLERSTRLAGGSGAPRLQRWVRPVPGVSPAALPPRQEALYREIAAAGEIAVAELSRRVPRAAALVRALERKGLLERFARRVFRDPFGEAILPDVAPALSAEQEEAVARVLGALGRGFSPFLLRGVTGSGKTEIYLRVAAEAVARGLSVLVLVPEIALISQTERRFRARFGERIAVLHSRLSEGERYDQWSRILEGRTPIAVGVRSAVFAPFPRLGLIVVDEEHDTSYKQEGGVPYHARDLALVRGRDHGAVVLLGSATPSLESVYNVRRGKYAELRLTRRIEERALPAVRLVDLRALRARRGPGRFLSDELKQALAETLDRGEQALVFLNRRGFAGFPVCAACGEALRCPRCEISLTLHRAEQRYRCHYCGFERPAAEGACGSCGRREIVPLGLGTEKVEEALRGLFPQARIARMDSDTARTRQGLLRLLQGLREKTIDIVVGTQMVAKGHDFPGITLVGIVCADLSLHFPDFRAGERTFQLLAQVAGRAGRGAQPGRVVLQTYNPEHFILQAACRQDDEAFYEAEIAFRRELGYPPLTRLVLIRVSGTKREETSRAAAAVGDACRALRAAEGGSLAAVEVLGPVEAPLARIAGRSRFQVLLKCADARLLHRFLDRWVGRRASLGLPRPVSVELDVDPVFLL